ncbi:MAG: S8 family serine peptidase [Tannerellaceae bacterium]|jgi:subtilisin family serine protease|nr:S8 family serine peptidase [Tannerellaceae bacterium]
MLHVSKTSDVDAMQTANLFYETELFEFAEPNLIDFNAENSYDPYFCYQWGLNNTGQSAGSTLGIDINAEQAWSVTKGHSSIRIAIIDSGIDLTHPDLQANLLPGYDATGYGTAGGIHDIYDNHGTAVAGIAGALQNNTYQGSFEGISGVAPGCKIVSVKASIANSFNRTHSSAAINWVADYDKAEVINCSFGSHYAPTSNLTNAIKNAINKGCVVVCSSGNNTPFATVSYPANSDPRIIVVGAVDQTGARSIWNTQASNYGAELDLVAPGTDVYTTDRQYIGYTSVNYYPSFSGTSAAAPHVAGVAALILSKNPNLTSQQVANIIESSAQKIGGYSYVTTSGRPNGTWNNQMGYGLVDAYMALLYTPTTSVYVNTPVISLELIPDQHSDLVTAVFSVDNPQSGVTYQWEASGVIVANTSNPYVAFESGIPKQNIRMMNARFSCRAVRNGTYSSWSNSITHLVHGTTPIPYTPLI